MMHRILDALLAQPPARQQPAEAAADDQHVDVLDDRLAGEAGFDIGILGQSGASVAGQLLILGVAVVAQPLAALLGIFSLQRLGVEIGWKLLRVAGHDLNPAQTVCSWRAMCISGAGHAR